MESVMAKHRLIKTWKQLQTLSLTLPYVMACERKQTFLLTSSANKRQRNRFPAMFVRGCLVIDKQPF